MPWKESSIVSQRQEFVMLASAENANIRQLCRRFGISPTAGYKWLGRYQSDGLAGLKDQSRRPKNSPRRSSDEVEQAVVKLRQKHPTWGGRKLRARLEALQEPEVPSASTITAILHRHQLITPEASQDHKPWRRFEHPHPNDLWQMDFKGDFALEKGRLPAVSQATALQELSPIRSVSSLNNNSYKQKTEQGGKLSNNFPSVPFFFLQGHNLRM
jgi:transposase